MAAPAAADLDDLVKCLAGPAARGWLPLTVCEAVLTLAAVRMAEPAELLDLIASAHGALRQAVGSLPA